MVQVDKQRNRCNNVRDRLQCFPRFSLHQFALEVRYEKAHRHIAYSLAYACWLWDPAKLNVIACVAYSGQHAFTYDNVRCDDYPDFSAHRHT